MAPWWVYRLSPCTTGSSSLPTVTAIFPSRSATLLALKKPGDLSGPVQTRRGIHLLQLVRLIPPEKKTFEQAG